MTVSVERVILFFRVVFRTASQPAMTISELTQHMRGGEWTYL